MARSRLVLPSASRRSVLRWGAGALGLGALGGLSVPLSTLAGTSSPRRFLFVFARGGWDTTRVFTPMFTNPRVDTEADGVVASAGDLVYVDHPARPSVRAFFERFGDRTAVIDGMLVRSVNHAVCERLVLTGTARPSGSAWPSLLGAAVASEHAAPTMVLSGPMIPGPHARTTALVGTQGQLQGLLDGSDVQRSDEPVRLPDTFVQNAVDAMVLGRAETRLQAGVGDADARMLGTFVDGLQRVERLQDDARRVGFTPGSLADEIATAVDVLANDVSRAVVVSQYGFDTHSNNGTQSPLLELVFDALVRGMTLLETTPSPHGGTMADHTVVVVLSEMGRTPYLNIQNGKDHWPYTAAMVVGPGVRGGRRLGGYDDYLNGRPVDLASGDVAVSGTVITPSHLGATILRLGGLDPGDWGVADPAISSILFS